MKALSVLILSGLFSHGVGKTIVERPVQDADQGISYHEPESRTILHWLKTRPNNAPAPGSQPLLELYYLIQVIIVFRHHHPRAHKTHLDALIGEMQDERFQQKIRQELHGIRELDEVDALREYFHEEWNHEDYVRLVNDRRQLIPVIARLFFVIDLETIEDEEFRQTLERLKVESSVMATKMLRKDREVLQDMMDAYQKTGNIWAISNIMDAIFGKQDRETMKEFDKKYAVVDDGKPLDDGKVEEFWVVIEDDQKVEPTSSTIAPEQVLPAVSPDFSREEIEDPIVVEDTITPFEDTITSVEEPVAEAYQFEEENYEQSEAKTEDEVSTAEEVLEESNDENAADELHDFEANEDDYERSVPEEGDQVLGELQDPIPEELQVLDASVEALVQPEPEYDNEPEVELTPEQSINDELEPAAKADTIVFPVDPQWVDDSVRPLGSAATGLDANPPKVVETSEELPWPLEESEDSEPEQVIPAEEVEAPLAQSVPLWISNPNSGDENEAREVVDEEGSQTGEAYEFDQTNAVESREGDDTAEPVQIDPDTLRYVAFEILKIVSLLEDNAGFQGLRDQITVQDVDHLLEQLSMEDFVKMIEEQGINRIEMINALERLIVEKNLEDTSEILAVLEQWKQGENAEPDDDGYFDENYGLTGEGEDAAQSRTLDDGQMIVEELEGVVQDVATPDEAREAEQLVDELEEELGAGAELHGSEDDDLNELEDEAELQNDSAEILEEKSEIVEGIPEVVESEAKVLQPFPEEVTEETEPLEQKRSQVVVEVKKLQPFPEEVTEETEPIAEIYETQAVVHSKPHVKNLKGVVHSSESVIAVANVTTSLSEKILPVPEEIQESPIELPEEEVETDSEETIPKTIIAASNSTDNHPFPETLVRTESLEVARVGTDEGTLSEERREEILEDQHPEP